MQHIYIMWDLGLAIKETADGLLLVTLCLQNKPIHCVWAETTESLSTFDLVI